MYLPRGLASEQNYPATESAELVLLEPVSEEEELSEPEEKTAESTGEKETEEESKESEDAATSDVITGDAEAEVTIVNEINTNIIADDYAMAVVVADEKETEGFDLSELTPQCREQFEALGDHEQEIIINNYAEIENLIEAVADTGNNNVANAKLDTGDATAAINLLNLVNTNLIGNCWFFGILNFFDPYSDEIILPYEQAIISGTTTGVVDANLATDVKNVAEFSQDLVVAAQTGSNSLNNGSEIQSGNATTGIQTLATLNNNYLGSNWLLIEIRNHQYWGGSFEGLNTHFQQVGDSWYYWFFPESSTNLNNQLFPASHHTEVKISNTAEVNNQLTASANTGGNVATGPNASINTGDATSTINVFNQLNTNIIGNNWYYLALNLFNPFTGTIVFPRADLTVGMDAAKKTLYPGESTIIQLAYTNHGREMARASRLNLILPAEIRLLESSVASESTEAGELQFELGDISSKEAGFINLLVEVNPEAQVGSSLTLKSEILTNTLESNAANNQSQLQLKLAAPAAVGGINQSSFQPAIEPMAEQLVEPELIQPEVVQYPVFPAPILGIATNLIPRAQAMTVINIDDSGGMCLAIIPEKEMVGRNQLTLISLLQAIMAKLLFAYASIT